MSESTSTDVRAGKYYNTFDDWFNELEGYSLRSERFFTSLTQFSTTGTPVNLRLWLEAAFEAGRQEGK